MFTLDKDVVIISEPRTGSHWVQSCLRRHYNLGEFFNVRNIEKFQIDSLYAKPSAYAERNLTESQMQSEISERFRTYESIAALKSVKIHKFQIDENILFWIKKKNLIVMRLERKNKDLQMKSLLIANHKKKFMGKLTKDTIVVTYENFIESRRALDFNKDIFDKLAGINIINLYYEDLLTQPKNDWFDPTGSHMVCQNSAEVVDIINWDEVHKWDRNFKA